MTITPALAAVALYAGLNTLILLALMAPIIRLRGTLSVSLGDGGHPALTRAMRAHGNAVETIPLALLLITIAALLGAPARAIHALGLMLTVGRALHGWQLSRPSAPIAMRAGGMALTLPVLLVAALGLIAHMLGAL
jgi:uncharacterized membrane protein YecN with MAPEG domain